MREPTELECLEWLEFTGEPTPDGEDPLQLSLDLRDERIVVWGGQSPRVLTKAYKKFRLEPLPPGGLPEE